MVRKIHFALFLFFLKMNQSLSNKTQINYLFFFLSFILCFTTNCLTCRNILNKKLNSISIQWLERFIKLEQTKTLWNYK
jgi:hypothetical protein